MERVMGRNLVNKRRFILVFLAAASVLFLNACKTGSGKYEIVADHLAEIMLPLDQAGAVYQKGLDAVGQYLDDQISIEEVHSILLEAGEEIQEMKADFASLPIPDQVKEVLSECQIDAVEYQSCADESVSQAAQYILDLDLLDQLCQLYGEQEKEEMRENYDRFIRIFEAMKGYHYYHINYFCAPWDEQAVSYVREHLLDQLTVYKNEYFTWESDRDSIEKIVMSYLDEIEACALEQQMIVDQKKDELESARQ